MDMYDTGLGFPKPTPRVVEKKRREKVDARDERAARAIVRARDGGRCRIPHCHARSRELHHLVFRARSRRLRWDPKNLISLCTDHHRLLHAGLIRISGHADDEIIVTGDTERLKFRL